MSIPWIAKMKSSLARLALAVASVQALHAHGKAAAFRTAYPGCQDKGVLKQAFQNQKDPGGAKAAAFLKAKVDSGACVQFAKGQLVSIDERDGALWCVRRTGDLDCFWTLDRAVDPNPPIASSGPGTGAGGGRKGRR
jgi:hypothetical protein